MFLADPNIVWAKAESGATTLKRRPRFNDLPSEHHVEQLPVIILTRLVLQPCLEL